MGLFAFCEWYWNGPMHYPMRMHHWNGAKFNREQFLARHELIQDMTNLYYHLNNSEGNK